MSPRLNKSLTLLELLIAIALISLIIFGFSSIDFFSRYHLISSDRRVKMQNAISFALEHMTKEMSRAIGNERVWGANNVTRIQNISGNNAIWAYIDANRDGNRDTTNDYWVAYRFTNATGNLSTEYRIWYCPQCTDATCSTCSPDNWGTASNNTIARQIRGFRPSKPGGSTLTSNYVEVELEACWDPDGAPDPCGSADNPNVTMRSRIKMPSVSTH